MQIICLFKYANDLLIRICKLYAYYNNLCKLYAYNYFLIYTKTFGLVFVHVVNTLFTTIMFNIAIHLILGTLSLKKREL